MKNTLLLIFFFSSYVLSAQSLSITGKVVDQTNGKGLPGAHISLLHPWGEAYKTAVAEINGSFIIEGLGQGGYTLKVSYLGYADYLSEVTLTTENKNLGNISLKEGSTELDEVEVVGQIPMATQEGDTTQYNADAFKTLPDADAQDLIEKMPGIVVQDGKVQAQGEDVTEVLVDGKPFFGQDPNAALKTLPAEVIDKIQVFDQRSEQANFTGFDNGETTKTINIITRPNMRNGQFGKVYGGYGDDNKYQIGGNGSIFDGNRRISLIGQSNNINIQNFATEDLLGVVSSGGGRSRGRGRGGRGGGGRGRGGSRGGGSVNDFLVQQQGGIAQTHAMGLNYSDQWGKKFEITGSYFFNYTDNTAIENSSTEYIDSELVSEFYDENTLSEANNYNHRLNFRMEYKIDSLNSIIFRPRLSMQLNDGFSNTLGSTFLGVDPLNATDNNFESDLSGMDFSNMLLYRHRFAGSRRTISLNVRSGYNRNDGTSNLFSEDIYYGAVIETDTLNQFSNLDVNGWNLSTEVAYTEPIGDQSTLMFTYRTSWQEDESDKKTFDYSPESQDFDELNETLSSVFSNDYYANTGGIGYNYRKGRDLFLMIRANAQWSSLQSDEIFPDQFRVERNYFNILPMAMLRFNFSRQENLRLGYFTRSQNPSVEQLQSVLDNSNPVQLTIGNPNLDQTITHRIFARYSKNNPDKATVFYAYVSANFSQDHIANALYLNETSNPIFDEIQLEPGSQLSQFVNVDGNWSLRSFLTYGLPIKPIKTNLNIDVNANFSRQPGLIDDVTNFSNNQTYGIGLTLSSNISRTFDFTLSSRISYNKVENTLQQQQNTNFRSQNTRLRLGWVIPGGWVLRSNLSHQYYDGLSEEFDQSYLLWTVGFGKKLFKNQRGEITLSVFDILNQNQSIRRVVSEVYIQDLQTNVLQRYALLKFTYNFRNFKTKKASTKTEMTEEERRRRWREGRF